MKTLDEILDLISEMNEEAHDYSWGKWEYADELENYAETEQDFEAAEERREAASEAQASYFRDLYFKLDETIQNSIRHWLDKNTEFRDEFAMFFGEEQFENEFESD